MIRLLLLGSVCVVAQVGAQTLQPEIRVDVMEPSPYSVEPGIGAALPMGYYVRASAGVGYALPVANARSGSGGDRWRADLLARVLLDPFRQQRWAVSFGGGLSYRRSATHIAAILDLEGPAIRGVLPALQFGVSGGFRAGVVLRRAMVGRR